MRFRVQGVELLEIDNQKGPVIFRKTQLVVSNLWAQSLIVYMRAKTRLAHFLMEPAY